MQTPSDCAPIEVSRRIAAPAAHIFAILADPRRHPDIDGSGMVLASLADGPVTAVGDVFVMKMTSRKWGDYEIDNHVVALDPDRSITWAPRAGRGHPHAGRPPLGHTWSYRLVPDGPTATVVTEIYDCTRAPAADRAEIRNGELWRPGMERTLEMLEQLATRAG